MSVTKRISSTEAQNKFGQVVSDVTQNQTRYIVERHNNPQIIIISFEDFKQLLNDDRKRDIMYRILKEMRPMYKLGHIIDPSDSSDES